MNHLLTFLFACVLPCARPMQDPARERIAAAFAATGFPSQKSPSGRSHLVAFTHGDRLQNVYVAVAPAPAGAREMHSIYTNVWRGKEPPGEELLVKVLGSARKFGSFYLLGETGGWSIWFGAQFDATTLPARPANDDPGVVALRTLIEFVNQVGEEMDRELNGDVDIR